jgi:hypothetical protein
MINRHSSASFSYAVQPPKNEEVYKWWWRGKAIRLERGSSVVPLHIHTCT